MSLPTPVQQAPSHRWMWYLAVALLLVAASMAWLNREGDNGRSSKRQRASSSAPANASNPDDLRRIAEEVHLRYLDSEGSQTPQEKLARAIQSVARSRRMAPEEVRQALDKYASMIQSQPSRIAYEVGLAALVRGDFEGAARAWSQSVEPTAAGTTQARDYLSSQIAMADSHRAAGRFEDAVRACEDARRFLNRERDPENWARVQAALFIIRFDQQRLDEAFSLAREVLELRERCLPPESPGIANALLNYGVCLGLNQRPAEAVPLYQRSIAIYEKAYGAGDVEVADASSELADALGEIEQLPEAANAAQRAIAIYETAGEGQAARLALALDRLGDILLSQQEPAKAEVPLRRAVVIYDRLPAPRAKDHAGAQHRLGLAIARAGRRVEALPHLKRSTILAEKFFAPDDPALATYYHNLAVWSDAAGDDPGTVDAYTRALRIFALHRGRTGRAAPQAEQTATFYAEYLRRSGVSEEDIVRRRKQAEGQ